MKWKAEEWRPFFALLPRQGLHGFVWGWCERRKLTDRYEDGFDHKREIRTVWQFRKPVSS